MDSFYFKSEYITSEDLQKLQDIVNDRLSESRNIFRVGDPKWCNGAYLVHLIYKVYNS